MKQLLTNPVTVEIELSLLEDVMKIIANAIHPQVTGGQLHNILNNLISLRDKAFLNKENNNAINNRNE